MARHVARRITVYGLFALAMFVGSSTEGSAQSPQPSRIAYANGRWWTGAGYERRTFYAIDGTLRSTRPSTIDQTIDLHGAFVIPPLAEGHNHWLEPSKVDQYNACYLADGVFYVRDMANVPYLVDQFRNRVNLPTSVDWVSAMTSFTGPGAHPTEVFEGFVAAGVLPRTWTPDYDKEAEYVVRTRQDIDERLTLLLPQHPAFVKAFLSFSEHYDASLRDPQTRGNGRGLDPALLPYLVQRAHALGLRVVVHVYTAPDFRVAVAAGADEVAHLPGTGYSASMPLSEFQITTSDAQRAARAHVRVTSTVSWLEDLKSDDSGHYEIAKRDVVVHNLQLLKSAHVSVLVGSDKFRRDVLPELDILRSLDVYSNVELLRLTTYDTPRAIFPKRKIGMLSDGYEANFLVLRDDPAADLNAMRTIQLRVKLGRPLAVAASAVGRVSPDCVEGPITP